MTYRAFNLEYDEPASGWYDEMIRHALTRGKALVVDENGDVWTFTSKGRPDEYVGKILQKAAGQKEEQEMKIPTMLTIPQVVERFPAFNYNFVRKLCQDNKICYVRAGKGRYLINLEKFVNWLNGNEPRGENK